MAINKQKKSVFLIVGAAPYQSNDIENYKRNLYTAVSHEDSLFVCCADGGVSLAEDMGLTIAAIVGDFDSMDFAAELYDAPDADIDVKKLNPVKDNTDLMVCVQKGIDDGYDDFILIGVTGGREDHFLGALAALEYLNENGKSGVIIDHINEVKFFNAPVSIKIADENTKKGEKDNGTGYKYFSILSLDYELEGVSIKGAKYEIEGFNLRRTMDRCISNETVSGQVAEISVDKGRGLIIRSR